MRFAEARPPLRKSWTLNFAAVLTVIAAGIALGSTASPARADLIVAVTGTGDVSDYNPGDGVCDVDPATAGDQCTLRAALEETNALPGSDAIRFAIPGNGVHRITPDTALPDITGPVDINGYSQPGAQPNSNDLSHPDNAVLRIELSGEDLPSQTYDLTVKSADSAIRGLVVNRAPAGGIIVMADSGTAAIEGNFVGTDPTGMLDRGNGYTGVWGWGAQGNIVVGGTDPADRNVISANGRAAFGSAGVLAFGTATVQGNFIGTQADGISALGNVGYGVRLDGTEGVVGGAHAAANVIAFNGASGISAVHQTSSTLSRDRIYGNSGLGIDIGDTGVTANDWLDFDAGPNDLQNFPVLVRATTDRDSTTIQGYLDSAPNASFKLEFFDNPRLGRQGKRFIGAKVVKTGANGKGLFSFQPARAPVGDRITATATNSDGSTSEFSAPRAVTAP